MNESIKYIEGENPGFYEFSPEDFADPILESDKERRLRIGLLTEIVREHKRLGISGETLDFLAHTQGLSSDPGTESLLNLRLFLDYLRKLEAK